MRTDQRKHAADALAQARSGHGAACGVQLDRKGGEVFQPAGHLGHQRLTKRAGVITHGGFTGAFGLA